MPRGPRIRSESGLYHIVMRGINRQTIFEDGDELREYRAREFIEIIEDGAIIEEFDVDFILR